MKIQIVYLSSADDVDSTRDKLAWVKSPRVLLIFPDRGRILADRLELVLIQRFAQRRNVQLGLLSFDSEVRYQAQELNIPVFDSLDELPEERWKDGHFQSINSSAETYERRINRAIPSGDDRGPRWKRVLEKERIGIPAPLVLLLFFIALFIIAPSAHIVLKPSVETHSTTLVFELARTTLDIEGDSTLSPERIDLPISGKASRPASGLTEVPTEFARGVVEFTNHSSDPILIPTDTILLSEDSDGIRVRTLESVLLPGGVGMNVEASVQAVQPGTNGNLEALSITAIEGPLGLVISVLNPRAMSGGADEQIPVITVEDQISLEEDLRRDLIRTALAELSPLLERGQVVPQGGVWIMEVLEGEFDHEVGDLGNALALKMRVKTTALLLDEYALGDLVGTEIGAALHLGEGLVVEKLNPEASLIIPASPEEPWQLEVSVEYQTYGEVDVAELRSRIAGRSLKVVRQTLLENIPDLEGVTIKNMPSWFPILPLWRDRIMIDIGWE